MIFDRKVIALVPMKAHSERVPNKNTRVFAGRPLYYHILDALEHTYAIDEVIVDTDSEEIAAGATSAFSKVRIVRRPEELRGDFVSMNKIIAHDLGQSPGDIYLQTHATNPLLKTKTLSNVLNRFAKAENHDSLFTVTRLQTRLYTADGKPINHSPAELIRTQDLPPVYEENSCVYVFTKESFESAAGGRIGKRPMMFELDRMESIDIDDEYTFSLAEILARYNLEGA